MEAAELHALLCWHALFDWPAIRALGRRPDGKRIVCAALDTGPVTVALVAVGQQPWWLS